MNFGILCIFSATIAAKIDTSAGINLVKEFLFPSYPMVTRLGYNEKARALSDPDAVFHTMGHIERYGYPAEEHKVITTDGYVISVFRIPGSPKSPAKTGKPVVFLQHGLLASSDSWVFTGPEHDLVYILADAGYDVWIGNVRGNSYGRSHTDLSPQDRDFWNFSFHEMAIWDIPAMIDHILKTSGQETLIYIGHSMGTTAAFVLLSERPEYNDRISLVIALAPVAFWSGPPNPLFRFAVENGYALKNFFDQNGIYEFAPQTRNNVRLGRTLCSDQSVTQPACAALYFLLAGDDRRQLNYTYLPQIVSYFPSGGSTQTMYHYMQNMKTGVFQQYDFGYTANFKIYGKKKPPLYDVKKVSAPIALIYGKNDIVAPESNIVMLKKRLQNVVTFEAVPYDTFNHLDFIWAINAKELLYNRILELISSYSK